MAVAQIAIVVVSKRVAVASERSGLTSIAMAFSSRRMGLVPNPICLISMRTGGASERMSLALAPSRRCPNTVGGSSGRPCLGSGLSAQSSNALSGHSSPLVRMFGAITLASAPIGRVSGSVPKTSDHAADSRPSTSRSRFRVFVLFLRRDASAGEWGPRIERLAKKSFASDSTSGVFDDL
jgi:hypothetical protein